MHNLFKLILSMSLSGSLLIAVLLFLRPLYQERFSKAWQYYVWLIVLLRLFIPFSPEFGLVNGLFQEAPAKSAAVSEPYTPSVPAEQPKTPQQSVVQSGHPAVTVPAASDSSGSKRLDPWKVAGFVWLAGGLLCVAFRAAQYARFARRIRRSAQEVTDERLTGLYAGILSEMRLRAELPVFQSPLVDSPMLMGIFRPAVFLPVTIRNMDDVSICYVFRHELTHYRRADLLYKWFAQMILCVHWFNPLVYFMSGRINRLCELSCDEAIAKKLNTVAKKEYGATLLLSITENRCSVLTTNFCEDKKSLKERLSTILRAGRKSKKLLFVSTLAAVVLLSAGICLGAFSSGSDRKQGGAAAGEKPYLTWEAVKELAGGDLSYSDISGKYYFQDIASGSFVRSYPIEDAADFSLLAGDNHSATTPAPVGLRCEGAELSLEFSAENLGIMMDLYNAGESQLEVGKLFQSEIPVPDGAKTYQNILYWSGQTPDTAMESCEKALEDAGWERTDSPDAKRYFQKNVQGNELTVSVSCPQEGKDPTTDPAVLRFALEATASEEDAREQREQEVRTLVSSFGQALKMVSLLAPPETVAADMEKYYAEYVTPELLQKWQGDPEQAPGRVSSSPWPERIDILSVEEISDTEYTVNGEVVEVTSVELTQGGIAAKRPVTLTVQKPEDRFLISDAVFGEYEQQGPVCYENTEYGFRFYLPETWEGYSIVEQQWQNVIAGEDNSQPAETGPEILIRNPKWTQEDPYQDIPILVFTTRQWDEVQNEKLAVSAAPIGPSKLGSNSKYVFALPPRYNFAFPTGYEEVETILEGSPLWAEEVSS